MNNTTALKLEALHIYAFLKDDQSWFSTLQMLDGHPAHFKDGMGYIILL